MLPTNGAIFNLVHTHATAATIAAAATEEKSHYVTDIIVSSDKAGSVCTLTDGTTTIGFQVGAGNFGYQFKTPFKGAVGAAVTIAIDGTSVCKVNMCGVTA